MAGRGTPKTVDELLAQARATLPHRATPAEALHAQANGALLVDIRADDQRRDGLIPGAIVIPRNSLEWRCDPASPWRHPAITGRDLHIILICNEGYQSSLAAATLQQLGLIHATDLDGGFTAWAAAGLPVTAPPPAGQHPSGNHHPHRSLR
jgi:rhodanese-related sulfurtransferase